MALTASPSVDRTARNSQALCVAACQRNPEDAGQRGGRPRSHGSWASRCLAHGTHGPSPCAVS
eukprot:5989029-Alexandrium_andersonii.AAC.1